MSRRLLVAAVCGLFSLVAGSAAQAAPITGGIGVFPGTTTTVPTPGNLTTATGFTFTPPGLTSSASGGFLTAVPNGSSATVSPMNFSGSTAGSVLTGTTTFSFGTGGTLGSITTTSGVITSNGVFIVGPNTQQSFDAQLIGIATIPGFDPTRVTIAFNATKINNGPVTSVFSIDATPVSTPAPASLAVLGLAFPGLLAVRRFRRQTA